MLAPLWGGFKSHPVHHQVYAKPAGFLFIRKKANPTIATIATMPITIYSIGIEATEDATVNAQAAVLGLPWVSITVSSMLWVPGCRVVE